MPMLVFGASEMAKGAISQNAQQQDLPISLRDLVSSNLNCRAANQGLIFRTPVLAASQVLHARGMPRDQIDVYTGDANHALKLAGDNSRWITRPPPTSEQVAAQIHLDRAQRAPNDPNFLETVIGLYSGKPAEAKPQ